MSAGADLLPGVSFRVAPPAPELTLPRMDVAAFVGLAAAGPLHVPVVVEDVGSFREVFGADAPLARDARTGATTHAHLGTAVEEFFRNGGRRCWVVRVADEHRARRSTFEVAGLVDAGHGREPGDPERGWRLGTVRARAAGGWADHLRVVPELVTTWLPPATAVHPAGRTAVLAGPAPVATGDTLRLTLPDATVLLVVLTRVSAAAAGSVVGWDAATVLQPLAAPAAPVRAAVVTGTGEHHVPVPLLDEGSGPGRVVLTLAGDPPPAGTLLRLDLDDGTTAAVVLDEPVVSSAGAVVTASAWSVTAGPSEAAAPPDPAPVPADPGPAGSAGLPVPAVVERLELALSVWTGEHRTHRLTGLGLALTHPRCWTALPTDEELYGRLVPGLRSGEPAGGTDPWATAAQPRFPLAGPWDRGPAGAGPVLWLPLGLPPAARAQAARGPVSDTRAATRADRDGLREITPEMFLDADLLTVGAGALVGQAAALTSLGPTGRTLRGIHAVAGVDEVTLVAVPDAVHPGWHEVTDLPPGPVPVPHLWLPDVVDGAVRLAWTVVPDAAGYVVEQGSPPGLADARTVLDGPAPFGPHPSPGPDPDGAAPPAVGLTLDLTGCPRPAAWRVRAVDAEGRTGGWSRTVVAVAPATDFTDCTGPAGPVPHLRLEDGATGPVLRWEPADPVAEVESGDDPLLTLGVRRATGAGRLPLPPDAPTGTYHRVRLLGTDGPGGWSRTVHRPARPTPVLVAHAPGAGELVPLTLAVHRALLRLAGGRADVLAVLSMPAHYRAAETRRHLAGLSADPAGTGPLAVRPLDSGETSVLGHGAVYHPWTVVTGPGGSRAVPPDGAATGVIARSTLDRGAWVSPGMQVLAGAPALLPALGDDDVVALLGAGVDVLDRRPAGVVALAARTLAADPQVGPIGVRRLLVLLRRLALQEGPTYVFEPHDHRFRAMVRRSFEDVLRRLHVQGAFAGAVAAESFRVVADATVNPPGAVDAGRFVVELQVAPAQPLVFVRVRLVQTGSGALTVAEVA